MSNVQRDGALARRLEAEALFHDHKYETGSTFPRHYAVQPTLPVFHRLFDMLGSDLSHARVLEYGCGTGWITTQLARRGAAVSVFDISPTAMAQTSAALDAAGVRERCDLAVMPGEHLSYPDNTFDVAVGFAILHHLDMDLALRELHRVLKPGGRAFFAEPIASNPLIRLYRRLTPKFRTADEVPIDLAPFAGRLGRFSRFEHHEQLLLATAALVCCYIPGLTRLAAPLQRALMRVDDAILRVVPSAGRWAWYSILVIEK